MTRIAFVHNSFPAGGAERITIDIARHLKDLGGYEVFVYATRVTEGLMPEDIHNLLTIRFIPSQSIQSRRSRQIEKFIVADGINILVTVGKSIYDISGINTQTTERVDSTYIVAYLQQEAIRRWDLGHADGHDTHNERLSPM